MLVLCTDIITKLQMYLQQCLSILDPLLLEMEVAALKETQEIILVKLATIEQVLKDGWEHQTKGTRLSPSLPQSTDDHLWLQDDTFSLEDPLDDLHGSYKPDNSLTVNT